jgi:hypothetical protein
MNKQKLKEIIEDLLIICNEATYKNLFGINLRPAIKPDDNNILDNAVKIYISENINESKKENIKEMRQIPATDSQKRYLEGRRIKFPKDITKQEAYVLIKEDKER